MSSFWLGLVFSPALILGFIVAGAPIIFGFILQAWLSAAPVTHYIANEQQKLQNLKKTINDIKNKPTLHQDYPTQQLFLNASLIKPPPESHTTGAIEIFRASGSAILKGKKEAELIMNPLQEQDAQGHYQDSPLMMLLIIPASLVYAAFYTLRAFVKGYGKDLTQPKIEPEYLSKEAISSHYVFKAEPHPKQNESRSYFFYRFFNFLSNQTSTETKESKHINLGEDRDHCTF